MFPLSLILIILEIVLGRFIIACYKHLNDKGDCESPKREVCVGYKVYTYNRNAMESIIKE